MEFQAYPTSPFGHKSTNAFWKTQGLLHRNDSVLLPCAILFIACGLVMYEHMTSPTRHGFTDNSIRNFLAMIVVTMVPLAFLEKKILACAEPVKMISKISGKVLFLHAAFLAVRAPLHYIAGGFHLQFFYAFSALISACVLLPTYFGFRLNRQTFFAYKEAFLVAGLAVIAAIITEAFSAYSMGTLTRSLSFSYTSYWTRKLISATAETSGLYMELTAFVPAVWMVCRPSKDGGNQDFGSMNVEADVAETRRRAVAFFAFLIGFYFTEDMVSAFQLSRELPLAALGHTAHFLLLLDFAGFLLGNLYDPEKLEKMMGSMLHALADACAV